MRCLLCALYFVLAIVFSACVESPVPPSSPDPIRPPSVYEDIKKQDQNRSAVLNESKEIYKGSPLCSSEKVCHRMCGEIFDSTVQEDCTTLPLAQVRRLNKIYGNLKNNDMDQLRVTRLSDLKVFLNVSPMPLERHFVKMGADSAKNLAWWIATDWDAARVFYEEDEGFFLLEALFKEIKFTVVSALQTDLREGYSYYKIAFEYGNEYALNWIHNYFINSCDNQEACLLSRYCRLNQFHYEEFSSEILEYRGFSEFVAHYMNKAPEWRNSVQSMNNLNEVCSPFCESHASGNKC
ncbi:MAG: hypothetical protein OXB86_01735 [Bdellovibrionales bacterium]|nr:hypothetical protein [Bdellovibrionales bacterium]